jgi:signal transduction histidine kinase
VTDAEPPAAPTPEATRRLFAAWRLLSAPVDVGELERWLPTLALEVTEAHGACLGVLDPGDGGFVRVLSVSAAHAAAGFGAERQERLLRALRDETGDGVPGADGLRAGRVTDEDGETEAFVVAPVLVRRAEHAWLCVSRRDVRFGAGEREALALLSGWAGLAIDNAGLLARAHAREAELVRAVRGLQASGAIAEAVSREPRLDLVLERIVEEALDLVGARTVLALLADRDELVVAAQAGSVARNLRGLRVPRDGTLLGRAMDHRSPHRADDLIRRELWDHAGPAGSAGTSGLFVPMVFRGRTLGVLAAIDRRGAEGRFSGEDERLLQSFAASAATAVASARSVAEDRMRRTVEATEQERRRWARELHDETLQGLGLLRIGITSALARPGADRDAAMRAASDGLADEIERLRALINELRPAGLDELGLEPALQALVERTRRAATVPIDVAITLGGGPRLAPDREVLAYRIVQESLTNVLKHAQARSVRVAVGRGERGLEVLVTDDGTGFDPARRTSGVGLVGMRERVELVGGRLEITSQPGRGTQVAAVVPDGTRPPA